MEYEKEMQTVLIVDDSPVNIQIAANVLKDDYLIKIAINAEDTLRIANSQPQPDLILLDIIMPEVNGYEVCKQLKQNESTRDIPIIFLTGMTEDQDEAYGLNLGAIDYVTKPFKPAIMKARVKNHLELKGYRDFLKKISFIDGLTGIANRRFINERFEKEWLRLKRSGNPLSVIMIDIDFFKNYNDHYGHIAGDECLQKIAECLVSTLKRPADLAGRWGGEEFICILPDTDQVGAVKIADQLEMNISMLGIPHDKSSVAKSVTVSMGVATTIPTSVEQFNILIERADDAMYRAKNSGRNRFVVWE